MATTAADAKAIGEINREWFDSVAGSAYQIHWVRDLVHQITTFLRENVQWIVGQPTGSGLRVLDYACGPGIVSMALAPFASALRGIDISGGMVEKYNETARHLGLSPEQMRGVRGDLLGDGDGEVAVPDGPEFTGFHIAVMSMALHHVADPAVMIKRLAERLAPGGSLVIVDWVTPEGPVPDHPAAHTVTRHGFSEKEMAEMFADAGLSDYSFRLHPQRSRVPWGETQQVFFARGRTQSQTV
ncbi:S-adenosyl-L-methionine-dependent methyltransferase [Chaetomium strumarium]|uniref:S-adenosyl-L-methionine-dependent methyltransferase n=1 Tax=Chaetomium strumarium TaxID=1170767 RepID=A0AAJ0M3C4_9PEZI|nr:S-adenosyl-L-methionine-dependent methyltransferase [Chaetomium strumarium]